MSKLDELRTTVTIARAALLAFDTCHCAPDPPCDHAIELECADSRAANAAFEYLVELDAAVAP